MTLETKKITYRTNRYVQGKAVLKQENLFA